MLSFSICVNVLGLRCVQIVLHTCMCMHLLLFLHVTNTESFLRKIKMFFVLLLQAARSRRRDWAGERAGTVSTTWSPTCSIRSASTLSCRTGPKGLQSPPLRRHVRTWALNTRVIHMLQLHDWISPAAAILRSLHRSLVYIYTCVSLCVLGCFHSFKLGTLIYCMPLHKILISDASGQRLSVANVSIYPRLNIQQQCNEELKGF